jgi:hypothetical protein
MSKRTDATLTRLSRIHEGRETTDRGNNPGDGQDGNHDLSGDSQDANCGLSRVHHRQEEGSGEETSIWDLAGILEEGDNTVLACC